MNFTIQQYQYFCDEILLERINRNYESALKIINESDHLAQILLQNAENKSDADERKRIIFKIQNLIVDKIRQTYERTCIEKEIRQILANMILEDE